MRFQAGSTDVPSAGTPVQISNVADRVYFIKVRGHDGNAGAVFFGISTVSDRYADTSNTGGWSLEETNTEGVTLDFRPATITKDKPGSVAFSSFYVDAANSGDDVDWIVLTE